jgi:methylthioribose-1-phosphate isomerase
LPLKEKYVKTRNYKDVIDAIVKLKIRGPTGTAAFMELFWEYSHPSGLITKISIHFYKLLESFRLKTHSKKFILFSHQA